MFNSDLYFKDNVNFIEQGNAKLASSILAAMNSNITSPARGNSVIIKLQYPSVKDGDFPPLPSPALPNHHNVSKKIGNPALKAKPIRFIGLRARPNLFQQNQKKNKEIILQNFGLLALKKTFFY